MEKVKFGKRSLTRIRHAQGLVVRSVSWLPNGHDLLLANHPRDEDSGYLSPSLCCNATPEGAMRAEVSKDEIALCTALAERGQDPFAISPDGRQAAALRLQPRNECWIDLIRPDSRAKSFMTSGMYAYPDGLEYTRSGMHLLHESIYTTHVWDLEGRERAAIEHLADNFGYGFHEPSGMIYSPLISYPNSDDKLRRWGRRPGTIERFDLSAKRSWEPTVWAEQPKVKSLRLHPSGTWLAAYGTGEIHSWEIPSGKSVCKIRTPKDGLRRPGDFDDEYISLDFNAAGDLLIVCDGDKAIVIRVFEGGGLEPLGTVDLGNSGGGTRVRTRFSPKTDVFYGFNNCGMHGGCVTTVDLTLVAASIR